MAERQRLFVAFEVPEDIRSALQLGIADLKARYDDARWLPLEAQHVTLKFLGYLEPDAAAGVREACAAVARGAAPTGLSLEGLGAFPHPGRARVLWAGIHDPEGATSALAGALDEACIAFGVAAEKRAFHPHLTLCRFKRPRRLQDLPQVPGEAQRTFTMEEIVLFRSHLSPRGARYEALDRFPLALPG